MNLWNDNPRPNDELAAYDALHAEYLGYAAEIRSRGAEPETFEDWAGYGESLWDDL